MLTPSSPSTSPSLPPQELNVNRKRQRSLSMQSATSSPKRAASEDLTSDSLRSPQSQSNDMSSLSLTDANIDSEIDSYLAEQPEDTLPSPPDQDELELATPAQKLATVEALCKNPMTAGETWYIVSRRWYRKWQKALSGEVDKEGGAEEKDIGSVDNSDLVDAAGNLTSQAIEHVDVEFVPSRVWDMFVEWYGLPRYQLPRKVITRGLANEPSLELHPPRVTVYTLIAFAPPGTFTVKPREVAISSKDTLSTVCRTFAEQFARFEVDRREYRVWKLSDGASHPNIRYTPDLLKQHGASLLDRSDKTVEEEMIEAGDGFVVEFQQNGFWVVDPSEIPASGTGTLSESQQTEKALPAGPLFSDGADFFGSLQKRPTSPKRDATSVSSAFSPRRLWPDTGSSSEANSKSSTQLPGTLGLGNMGNTCFMNSALQCLTHTQELTDYFLTGVYEDELNFDNPLGMHGQIAQAFGALLRRIWAPSSGATSYSPREFKQVLQRFAPQFSGYQQHDSQELVAFLLDGLHEDLNRILKKPYVEKPDWEGGDDKDLVKLANESWQRYLQRNDSVIVDLFQGQYQSTLVCPECSKVSITFDPFMYLTLPLPVQKKWSHTVFYVPWDLSKPHVKIPVEIGRDASFRDLRQLLGRWMDAEPDNLLTLEIFNSRFYKDLDDTCLVGEVAENDIIVCFELPCHAQQSRTYKPQPDDPFIIPVALYDMVPQRQTYNRGSTVFGYPFITVISQEQARDPDAMYDAVVERLQRWTANVRDLYNWEAGPPTSPRAVQIPLPTPPAIETVTEIKENGDIVTVTEDVPEPEEGDIVDEKSVVVRESEDDAMEIVDEAPRKVGFKKDIFRLRVQSGNTPYGVGYSTFGMTSRFDSWENRAQHSEDAESSQPVLLRRNDSYVCEFDENMKAYYFGDDRSGWDHARWEHWEEFLHPEYVASRKNASQNKHKGITLQDCLDEFTREERLGEDDLWYCPSCKKHQQATKRFDLWKAPDVLVVHLKRFSNSRALRDKIDTFVDFPIEGLDLTDMVGERQVAKRLLAQGVDTRELGMGDLDEPLVYDLFAVDEHLGGLGGGHYRAYALNHTDGQWYHFDDSYVSPSRPEAAVNSNAYLLFYRRRAAHPLGGKSHDKVEAARQNPQQATDSLQESHLPTPPGESSGLSEQSLDRLPRTLLPFDNWPTPRSNTRSSPASSPPPLDDGDDEPPPFEEDEELHSTLAAILPPIPTQPRVPGHPQFRFPDPPSRDSPTSSTGVEPDTEIDDFASAPTSGLGLESVDNDVAGDVTTDLFDGAPPEWRQAVSDGTDPSHVQSVAQDDKLSDIDV
ncbi:UCH-domain-containing protein [Obba rivulosa]|uniref:ubiquitinyl hydrolase 1 n=1 Tax=Obba rivulosa TaxID=1052685 RepID=A0A8E2AMR5_9APHY|nr:UCH-domain-containing protein [Obba rivulosa]